jgi:hypothetical protein
MTPTQKHAWFNLAVVVLSVVTVVALVPVLGLQRAQGGFGWLGLLGFGVLFYRKRAGQVVADERDRGIRMRSMMIAYSVFWVAFVLTSVLLPPYSYGAHGAVPVAVVQASVWFWFILVTVIESVATLVQYGRGGFDAS